MDATLLVPEVARHSRRYPAGAVAMRPLADGRPLLIRPIAARDTELMQEFVRGLSVTSRYQRFQSALHELPPGLLSQLIEVDYRGSMALVAMVFEHGTRRMIGEARYAPALDGSGTADFALAVADRWQRQGIGRLLMDGLLQYAGQHGVTRIRGDVLHGNTAMIALARQLGFAPQRHPDGAWLTRVERSLGALPLAA